MVFPFSAIAHHGFFPALHSNSNPPRHHVPRHKTASALSAAHSKTISSQRRDTKRRAPRRRHWRTACRTRGTHPRHQKAHYPACIQKRVAHVEVKIEKVRGQTSRYTMNQADGTARSRKLMHRHSKATEPHAACIVLSLLRSRPERCADLITVKPHV